MGAVLGACSTQHLPAPRMPLVVEGQVHAVGPPPQLPAASALVAANQARPFDNGQLWSQLSFLAASVNAQGGPQARLQAFGRSHLNAPLWALRISGDQVAEPGRKATVLLLAQQHGDDAGSARALVRLAESVSAGELDEVLNKIDLILVPRLNPDGFAAGRKTNAQGVDIDHDHFLLSTPESQALAHLMLSEEPVVFVELGSRRHISVLVQAHAIRTGGLDVRVAAVPGIPPLMARAAREWFRDPVTKGRDVKNRPWLDPNTLLNVTALRNTVALGMAFSSTEGVAAFIADPGDPVKDALRLILQQASVRADDLLKLRHYVRRQVAEQACRGTVPFPVGDRGRHSLRPCGYWLSANSADAVARLRTLGLEVTRLDAPAEVLGDRYIARQGASGVGANIGLVDSLIDMPTDSFYVSLDQPLANLAIMTLQPNHPDGYLAQGVITDIHDLARLRKPLIFAHDELAMPLQVLAP